MERIALESGPAVHPEKLTAAGNAKDPAVVRGQYTGDIFPRQRRDPCEDLLHIPADVPDA